MAFSASYSKLFLPKFLLHTFFLLSIFKRLISLAFRALGLVSVFTTESDVIPMPPYHLTHHLPESSQSSSVSTDLIRKILTVVKFEDLVLDVDGNSTTQDSCAVCLCEFEGQDEIRPLIECRHIFHRSCLDRWMDHEHRTCPVCRTPFIGNKYHLDQQSIQVGSDHGSES